MKFKSRGSWKSRTHERYWDRKSQWITAWGMLMRPTPTAKPTEKRPLILVSREVYLSRALSLRHG